MTMDNVSQCNSVRGFLGGYSEPMDLSYAGKLRSGRLTFDLGRAEAGRIPVECDCGEQYHERLGHVCVERATHCGCGLQPEPGTKIGDWSVLETSGDHWTCKCDCGHVAELTSLEVMLPPIKPCPRRAEGVRHRDTAAPTLKNTLPPPIPTLEPIGSTGDGRVVAKCLCGGFATVDPDTDRDDCGCRDEDGRRDLDVAYSQGRELGLLTVLGVLWMYRDDKDGVAICKCRCGNNTAMSAEQMDAMTTGRKNPRLENMMCPECLWKLGLSTGLRR